MHMILSSYQLVLCMCARTNTEQTRESTHERGAINRPICRLRRAALRITCFVYIYTHTRVGSYIRYFVAVAVYNMVL